MSTGLDPLALGPGERTISRAPRYYGGEFVVSEIFDTYGETNEYVKSLVGGYADAFLADAWYRIVVSRRRNEKGQYIRPPWLVTVVCRRPRPGETSADGDPSDPSQILEVE